MRIHFVLSPLLGLGLLVGVARAQTGTLDQVSPHPSGSQSAGFNGDAPSLIWQCQVRTGIAGQLEGVTVSTSLGSVGQTCNVRLRVGAGWNTNPPAFSGLVVKTSPNEENIFVNMTSANVMLNVNDLYVIEMQGTGTGFGIAGSYVAPPGIPLYPEPLFLNGPGCFNDCGWRIAFQTWMNGTGGGGFPALCFGDGSGAVPCPCNNSGTAGHGCQNSAGTGGALLGATGTTHPDTIVLHSSGELPTALTIFLQGSALIAPLNFGDGLRCAGGALRRLYVKSASGGSANAPQAGDPSVSQQSANLGDPILPGSSRWYQAYYRDSNQTFCPIPQGNTFNITNAIRIDW
jgi:hypothetical protein